MRDPAETPYRVVLSPIGNPLPVGMLALLVSTTAVATIQLGWLPSAQSPVVGRAVVAIALVLQLPGALLGFRARDPAAGTGMAVLGATWLVVGLTLATTTPGVPAPGLGVLLIGAAVALLVPIAASLAKPVTVAVLTTSLLRFVVTGVSELGAPPGWKVAAGVLGLVLGVVALYAAMAFELEDVHQRSILPMGRKGPAREAFDGSLDDQLEDVSREAGVRRQL